MSTEPRLYRKCSGRLSRSIGCDPPRWISNNDYYLEAVWKLAIYCGGARIASLRHDGGKNCVV